MSAPIPLRDYPVVQRDPILSALYHDLRAKLRPGDVPMVSEARIYSGWRVEAPAYRVWVRHANSNHTFGPHRPTLAQAIDALIAKLR